MFRGWSRLCLHAASLSAAEGASAAATAVARAARADAAPKEVEAAAASPRETAFGSKLMADLELKVQKIEKTVQEHQLRRVQGLVRPVAKSVQSSGYPMLAGQKISKRAIHR